MNGAPPVAYFAPTSTRAAVHAGAVPGGAAPCPGALRAHR